MGRFDDETNAQYKVEEIDKLYNNVRNFRSTKYNMELLYFISKFPNIAPYNAMLVYMQKPGSHYVASAKVWQEKFGRYPKSDASPLLILHPFGPVSFVFEASDTEGDPLPIEIMEPFSTEREISPKMFYHLENNMMKEGILLKEKNYGTGMAGKVQRLPQRSTVNYMKSKRKRVYVFHEFDIVVNSNYSMTDKAATIFHELGHYFCGHLGMPEKTKHIPKRHYLTDQIEEFEAETVCWLVCKRLGIVNPSEEYLKNYLVENDEIPNGISIDAILKACGKIENMLNDRYTTPKEIIHLIEDIDSLDNQTANDSEDDIILEAPPGIVSTPEEIERLKNALKAELSKMK